MAGPAAGLCGGALPPRPAPSAAGAANEGGAEPGGPPRAPHWAAASGRRLPGVRPCVRVPPPPGCGPVLEIGAAPRSPRPGERGGGPTERGHPLADPCHPPQSRVTPSQTPAAPHRAGSPPHRPRPPPKEWGHPLTDPGHPPRSGVTPLQTPVTPHRARGNHSLAEGAFIPDAVAGKAPHLPLARRKTKANPAASPAQPHEGSRGFKQDVPVSAHRLSGALRVLLPSFDDSHPWGGEHLSLFFPSPAQPQPLQKSSSQAFSEDASAVQGMFGTSSGDS